MYTALQVPMCSFCVTGCSPMSVAPNLCMVAGRGAVHRSPEAGPCAPRLLLVLDDATHFTED